MTWLPFQKYKSNERYTETYLLSGRKNTLSKKKKFSFNMKKVLPPPLSPPAPLLQNDRFICLIILSLHSDNEMLCLFLLLFVKAICVKAKNAGLSNKSNSSFGGVDSGSIYIQVRSN